MGRLEGRLSGETEQEVAIFGDIALGVCELIPTDQWSRKTYLDPRDLGGVASRIDYVNGFEASQEVPDGRITFRIEKRIQTSWDHPNQVVGYEERNTQSRYRIRIIGPFTDDNESDGLLPMDIPFGLEKQASIGEFYKRLDKEIPGAKMSDMEKVIGSLAYLIDFYRKSMGLE